ncbi:MAG: adenosine kinase [Acidimicrobiia bacterium]|nr:adenosine kinase [Acidimicrobiia bacterium]
MSTDFAVVGIGNALVDVLAQATDEFIEQHELAKGAQVLIDTDQAVSLYETMGPGVEISGGSAANTMAGIASLGGRSAFVGRVNADQLGDVYSHDLRAAGVHFVSVKESEGTPTGRCLILVTPDAQRTMNTYLGASSEFSPEDIDANLISASAITYLEGYLWDQPSAQEAVRYAAQIAHESSRRVALTLSDGFVVERHRDGFLELLDGDVDILFANETEICSLYEVDSFDEALKRVTGTCEIAALTRGPQGAVLKRGDAVHVIDPFPVPGGVVVDTTGAGDLFAAGVLHGLAEGLDLGDAGRLGALAAAEIISHIGARPEQRLADLATANNLL